MEEIGQWPTRTCDAASETLRLQARRTLPIGWT